MSHAKSVYPRATYRVQLHSGFTLDELTARVPYLHALGISDVYCPPLFQATSQSRHGYDICDYDQVSNELGGDAALGRLSAALRERGMGLLLDFVPNHMGVDADRNGWWREVLEHGQRSCYADFFDIRWDVRESDKSGYVVLPLLPAHYGCLLQEGKLFLNRKGGCFDIVCDSVRIPLRAATYAEILKETEVDELTEIAVFFGRIEDPSNTANPKERAAEFDRLKHQLGERLNANESARERLDNSIAALNGTVGDHASFDRLDELIGKQHYSLSRWQAGAHGINYRRFFAINTLIGLRMEDSEVFERTHARLGRLIADGVVTGVRIDHIDGLRDPQLYLERLKELTEANRPVGAPRIYVVVEKILADGEALPEAWRTDGTTGYDFVPQLAGLFTDAEKGDAFNEIFSGFTDMTHDFHAEVRACKKIVLGELFPSAVLTLAQELHELLKVDRRWRDLTVPELAAAIGALVTELLVYRTYRRAGKATRPEDHRQITRALTAVLRNHPRIEPELVIFVAAVWLGDYPEKGADETHRAAFTEWVMNLQQYTGAVMAKSVEDTAYYTYNRLIALNEVGGFPGVFGADAVVFHQSCVTRLASGRGSMLTTSTHDTKNSEDVRARLHALSEMPERWAAWLCEWRELNSPHKTLLGGKHAPDAQEEYRLYQTLLGAWPLDGKIDDAFRQRIGDYFEKAIDEAKVNTTTAHPSPDWIAACRQFSDTILTKDKSGAFIESFYRAATQLAKAGCVNSLAQLTLKLTTPGVPDIFQGNETWNFSLVDPDNRRDVDFDAFEILAKESDGISVKTLFAGWKSGGIKFEITRRILRFRREFSELFEDGSYIPLEVSGKLKHHVLAFSRGHTLGRILVVVPRLVSHLSWSELSVAWGDTSVSAGSAAEGWENILGGVRVQSSADGAIRMNDLFADIPIAVFFARVD